VALEAFRRNVARYREIGISIESLALGCSVKVDLYDVLYPSIKLLGPELERLNIVIAPREDVAVLRGSDVEIMRMFGIGEPRIDRERLEAFAPDAAIVLVQVWQMRAMGPEGFAEAVAKLYRALGSTRHRVWVGKGHSIISTRPDAELYLVDLLKTGKGDEYVLANNDTMQIIDPGEEPASEVQVATAINNALNDLFTKGAWRGIKIAPVYDAPEQYLDRLEKAVKSYAAKLGEVVELEQPRMNYLLIGATVTAKLDREPPMFYKHLTEDYVIVLTRPIGELSIFTTYVVTGMSDQMLKLFESSVMSFDELDKLRRRVAETLAKPNIEVAKAIYRHLPELGQRFDPSQHIAATIDVSGPGIMVFKEVAEAAQVDIELFEVPHIAPEVARFAAENHLMPDATAGTNGAIAIFAPREVAEELVKELSSVPHLEPRIIGRVLGRGEGRLVVPSDALRYISSPRIRAKLEARDVLSGLTRRVERPAAARIIVAGDVIGVGFRPRTRTRALQLGLTGYARNTPDGKVEVFVEGDEAAIRKLLNSICEGVENCRVEAVEWLRYEARYSDFEIR